MSIIQSETTLDIPTHLTVPEFMLQTRNKFNSKPEVLELPIFINPITEQRITHRELRSQIQEVASSLYNEYNIRRGSIVAIISPNHINYSTVLLAALSLGAIVTTANPSYTDFELESLLGQFEDLKLIFCTISEVDKINKLFSRKSWNFVPKIIDISNSDTPPSPVVPFNTLLQTDINSYVPLKFSESLKSNEVPALIIFSSGTTGKPKGVVLSHHNLIANLIQTEYACRNREVTGRVNLGLMPFFHCYGIMMLIFHNIHSCMTSVLLPKFDWELLLKSIEIYKIESLYLVPPVLLKLANDSKVDDFDLTSVKIIFCGAAPLPETIHKKVASRLDCETAQVYGMSECMGVTMQQSGSQKIGSLGELFPNIRAKIKDTSTSATQSLGDTGELWISGPNIMMGYYNKEAETSEMFDEEGFMRTGDVGYFSDEAPHEFYIVDRAKEIIKYKGFQVSPAELESVILGHPRVKDCCVIGTPYNQNLEEMPAALVVLNSTSTPTQSIQDILDDIKCYTNGRVANYKHLRGGVKLIAEIPKSNTGKILRRAAKENYSRILNVVESEKFDKS